MLELISCKSSPKADNTPLVVYKVPPVYFPKVPAVKDGIIMPVDAQFHAVTTDEQEIQFLVIPYWYAELWLRYAEGTEAAIKSLYAIVEEYNGESAPAIE